MIKINLLHEKKAKRSGPGEQSVLVGFLVVLLLAAGTYFFIHAPLEDEVSQLEQGNARLRQQISKLQQETKDFDVIKQKLEAVRAQSAAIRRLNDARAVPAWMMRELSSILTGDHKPTMTPAMQERVKTDQNRRWNDSWDPKRLWLESFQESQGKFTLVGGAQADTDVTQFALRLQASVFFDSVQLEGAEGVKGKGVGFYRFTIKGKVLY